MQEELNREYSMFKKGSGLAQILRERLSPPLLLNVPEAWELSTKRILVVGQETLGWGFKAGEYYAWPYESILSFDDFLNVENSVEALIHGYVCFEFARHQPDNYNSPFWRAYRQVRELIKEDVDGNNTAVLWTNLFRMSLDGGSVVKNGTESEVAQISAYIKNILLNEISILKPNSVIFFTGPDYNQALLNEFDQCEFNPFGNYDVSQTSYVKHPCLPKRSIRTYHPGYLARSEQWGLLKEVIGEVI